MVYVEHYRRRSRSAVFGGSLYDINLSAEETKSLSTSENIMKSSIIWYTSRALKHDSKLNNIRQLHWHDSLEVAISFHYCSKRVPFESERSVLSETSDLKS